MRRLPSPDFSWMRIRASNICHAHVSKAVIRPQTVSPKRLEPFAVKRPNVVLPVAAPTFTDNHHVAGSNHAIRTLIFQVVRKTWIVPHRPFNLGEVICMGRAGWNV